MRFVHSLRFVVFCYPITDDRESSSVILRSTVKSRSTSWRTRASLPVCESLPAAPETSGAAFSSWFVSAPRYHGWHGGYGHHLRRVALTVITTIIVREYARDARAARCNERSPYYFVSRALLIPQRPPPLRLNPGRP